MEEIIKTINEPISQIIALGVVLVFYAICYSVRLAGGKRRTTKQKVQWSWERFWNDLHFRLWIGYALVASVVAIDLARWLMPLIGVTVSAETAEFLNANLIISLPFIAGINELARGVTLLFKVWRYKENLEALGATVDVDIANPMQIAADVKESLTALYNSINSQQEDPEAVAGEVLSKAKTKQLAEMGSIPYYKVDVSTPELAYKNLLGKGFNEGWGYQCVAGFKEFMFSLCGRYVAAGGAASGYTLKAVREQVCKLGFTWHDGAGGLRDGCWGIWTDGLYGHVAMYYQGKWLGQNQGAADGNAGNAFNLMALPMQGFAGYFLPNIYAKAPSEPTGVMKTTVTYTIAPAKDDVIEYTYKPGDNFGQVITDLGLKTSHGLWGSDGDVAYYTAQLAEQGITGNVPVGKTITLKRRK